MPRFEVTVVKSEGSTVRLSAANERAAMSAVASRLAEDPSDFNWTPVQDVVTVMKMPERGQAPDLLTGEPVGEEPPT